MLQYLNEFGIDPERGSNKSVGLDFKMPNPKTWKAEQREAFCEYVKEQKMDAVLTEPFGFDGTDDAYVIALLYLSHRFAEKNDISFREWRLKYIIQGDSSKYILRVEPGQSICAPTGIRTLFDPNTYGEFENKSGMASKGWNVGAKVVDEDYTGIVHSNLQNVSDHTLTIECGQKLAQLIERKAVYDTPKSVDKDYFYMTHGDSERGSGGFGSTGK